MIIDVDNVETFLEHHGVKGQKWGIRNNDHPGASSKVNREASKDAKEHARAKAFYGEGAGTRRKLIKQKVEGKVSRLPGYKQAFDHHLALQDTSKHVDKAVAERKRTDRKQTAKQVGGSLARRATGEMGTKAAFTAVALGGAAYLKSGKGKAHMAKASKYAKTASNKYKQKQGAKNIVNVLRRNGMM